jgi:hypothetical protein
MNKLNIFIILVILFFTIDLCYRLPKCKNISIKIILLIFLHRLFLTLIYYGWIFDNKVFLISYLFLIILLYLYWLQNDWKCDITKIENNLCKYDTYTNFDYFYIIFNEKIANIIFFTYTITIFFTVFYKLYT